MPRLIKVDGTGGDHRGRARGSGGEIFARNAH